MVASHPFLFLYTYMLPCMCVYIYAHTVRDSLCPDDVKQAVRLWEACVSRNIIISALLYSFCDPDSGKDACRFLSLPPYTKPC